MVNIFEELEELGERKYVSFEFELHLRGIQMHVVLQEERELLESTPLPVSEARRLVEWLQRRSDQPFHLSIGTLRLYVEDDDLEFVPSRARTARRYPTLWAHLFEVAREIETLGSILDDP